MRFCAAALAACLLGVACGSEGGGSGQHQDAVQALARQFGYLGDGQLVRLYSELHPAQQELVTEEHFVECYQRLGDIEIGDLDVRETFVERVTIPGTGLRSRSVAITADVTADFGTGSQRATDTYHEVRIDGTWRWTMALPSDFADGDCPS